MKVFRGGELWNDHRLILRRRRPHWHPLCYPLSYFATTQFQQKIRSYFSTRLRTPKQPSLVKKAHTQKKPHTKEERARASLAGHTTTTRGSLANARGKESVVAANST